MPVVAVQHDTALGGICLALSGEVKDNIGAVIGLDGLHGVCRTAVGAVDENHLGEFVSTAQQIDGMASVSLEMALVTEVGSFSESPLPVPLGEQKMSPAAGTSGVVGTVTLPVVETVVAPVLLAVTLLSSW